MGQGDERTKSTEMFIQNICSKDLRGLVCVLTHLLFGTAPPDCAAKEKKTCDISRIPFTVVRRGPCLWYEKLTAFGCQGNARP